MAALSDHVRVRPEQRELRGQRYSARAARGVSEASREALPPMQLLYPVRGPPVAPRTGSASSEAVHARPGGWAGGTDSRRRRVEAVLGVAGVAPCDVRMLYRIRQ